MLPKSFLYNRTRTVVTVEPHLKLLHLRLQFEQSIWNLLISVENSMAALFTQLNSISSPWKFNYRFFILILNNLENSFHIKMQLLKPPRALAYTFEMEMCWFGAEPNVPKNLGQRLEFAKMHRIRVVLEVYRISLV